MPIFDLALEELREYRPDLTKRDDFDAFWAETLAKARQQPLEPTVEAVSYPVPEIRAFAATYRGWQGGTVGGWYLLPHGEQPFPAMIFYHGYSNTKQGIYNYLPWVLQGYAVLAVDVRDQPGASTDPGNYSAGHSPGWMTKGILDKQEYYYRGVYVDSVRALDFLDAQGNADMSKVGLAGFSQGGGLSLAVAALDDRPALSMPQMPFLCHFE